MMKNLLKLTIVLVFVSGLLLAQGCTENREEMEKEIVAHDSSFQSYIDKRISLQEKLTSEKNSFVQQKLEIEDEINSLKEKELLIKEEHIARIGEIKRQIQPEKRRLSQDLLEMKRKLGLKKIELKGVVRDINEINSLIKRKDKLALTSEEVRTWNDRLSSLIEKKAKISAEISSLDKEIEITRLKIKVMTLD